jgi:glycosyltransferase involved in cell wall biosynthesis
LKIANIRLSAAIRHPFKREKRRQYREDRLAGLAARARSGVRRVWWVGIVKNAIRLEAVLRHPFKSEKRKAFRNERARMLALALSAAFKQPGLETSAPAALFNMAGSFAGLDVSTERGGPIDAVAGPSPDIVYVVGCWPGESKRYRAFNAADVLRAAGYKVELLREEHIGRIQRHGWRPKAIVIFRTPATRLTEACVAYARKHGIKLFFDVDDLVFEPSIVDQVDGYRLLPPSEKRTYVDGVRRYRKLLLETDAVIATTEPLARAARQLGKPAFVVKNTFNRLQKQKAETILAQGRPRRDFPTIGYFSGSRTHNKDFGVAAPALLRLLRDYPELRLTIVGELDIGAEFQAFSARIERLEFIPYLRMQEVAAQIDINIAPLSPDNPFNEAKSELKWFESALIETPSVVSNVEPYRAAIRDGETGLLAGDADEWYQKLNSLIDDPALARRIGQAARLAVLDHWGPDAMLAGLRAVLPAPSPSEATPERPRTRKTIDWIVPGLLIGGGGHRNILRAAHFLEQSGHDVGLVFTEVTQSAEELRALIHQHFYPFKGPIRVYDGIFRTSDVLFATHWSTVYPALEAAGTTREIIYFIQDFEPMFYPMGTEYILAENTYRKGLYGISSGPWCADVIGKTYGMQVDHFEFPIDRNIYHPRPRKKQNANILYFAKPDMPRRCYELGKAMLAEFHRLAPDVEIIFFGSRHVDVATLGFPATVKGLLPSISDLAQAYCDADLGVAFSTTNPSLVPYEIMACGTPVADLDRIGNEVNYGGRRDVAFLGDPDPKRMARQIAALLRDRDEIDRRIKNGLELTAKMPDEIGMAKRIEELILKRLGE